MRGDCLFCWYWWNWWPSLFKLSFYITFITYFVNRSDGIIHSVYLNFSKIIKHWHTAYRIILLCKTVVTCSTITEYLCYRWPPVYSACRMLISSFFAPHSGFITEYVYHRMYNKQHEVRTMPLMERELLTIHRAPASSHWQTLLTNFITWTGFELTHLAVIDTDCTGSCKSNYHTITTTTASRQYLILRCL
jgi:hypothetical protein